MQFQSVTSNFARFENLWTAMHHHRFRSFYTPSSCVSVRTYGIYQKSTYGHFTHIKLHKHTTSNESSWRAQCRNNNGTTYNTCAPGIELNCYFFCFQCTCQFQILFRPEFIVPCLVHMQKDWLGSMLSWLLALVVSWLLHCKTREPNMSQSNLCCMKNIFVCQHSCFMRMNM